MRVTIVGATGGTGREAMRAARAAGHEVTVLVRDAAALGVPGDRVAVVEGDARDPVAVGRAVAGAEALISAVGSRSSGRSTLITDCMRTVLGALPEGTRLLAVSTVGAGGSGNQLPWAVRPLLTTVLRHAIADHDGQERLIMASSTDWTIARCVGLTDRPATGELHTLTEGRVGGSSISRADVGDWLVANLRDPTWSHRAVTLW